MLIVYLELIPEEGCLSRHNFSDAACFHGTMNPLLTTYVHDTPEPLFVTYMRPKSTHNTLMDHESTGAD